MIDDEVEATVDLCESDKQSEERVPQVNGLKCSTETVNALTETKYCKNTTA